MGTKFEVELLYALVRGERDRLVEALRFLRDSTYVDAEGPELRAQNERAHAMCSRILRELGEE